MRFSLYLFIMLFGAYTYAQVPTDGLVAHYPFNGSANDVSGYNNNGQLNGGIGRTDLPGGDTATLRDSILREILSLPDEALLLSGHGPATTVGLERRQNPFLRQWFG